MTARLFTFALASLWTSLPISARDNSLSAFPLSDQWRGEFDREGFLILRKVFTKDVLRSCRRHLSNVLWSPVLSRRPHARGVVTDPGKYLGKRHYEKMLRNFDLPTAASEIRNRSYRLESPHNLPRPNPWLSLIEDPRILQITSELVGTRTLAKTALLFERGSQQALHEDTWYGLGGRRAGGMVGVWFALDDVDDDNGPLLYVPGSHLGRPEQNYSRGTRSGRKHRLAIATDEHRDHAYGTADLLMQFAKPFHARAGDVGIWHERLIHGGALVRNPRPTRLSMVVHYSDGAV